MAFKAERLTSGRHRVGRLPSGVHLIGEGHVGGKAAGIIFVKRQMEDAPLTPYDHLILFPDSTVLTTAVFDEFIHNNRLAQIVEAKCRGELEMEEMARRFLAAGLPAWSVQRLRALLERERRPLVVRSSSLMEDDLNRSFAGIYLSEFLPNSGDLEGRLEALISSIKRVYVSTFGENARAYRKRYGLPWEEERMAVLIQNMVGSHYPGGMFYPLVSGVAFSRNFYPWTERLRQEDGVARLVIGVGTRAVGRAYARVFSPQLPGLRPEGRDPQEIIRYAQEIVDVLDMTEGNLSSVPLNSLENPHFPKVLAVAGEDGTLIDYIWASKGSRCIALFDRLLETDRYAPFTSIVQSLLTELEKLFRKPVDVEFSLDFVGEDRLAELVTSDSAREAIARGLPDQGEVGLFYLLQARHLGCREEHRRITIPDPPPARVLLKCRNVLGNGHQRVEHLIFVDPDRYRFDRGYEVARKVGKLDRLLDDADEGYILIGPGRWATSNPQLGVPVRYSEIAGAAVIVEMATERFSPELSYGTHFYADMVASGTLYLSYDAQRGDRFNRQVLKDHLTEHSDGDVLHLYFAEGLDVYVDGQERRGVIVIG